MSLWWHDIGYDEISHVLLAHARVDLIGELIASDHSKSCNGITFNDDTSQWISSMCCESRDP